MTTFDNNGFTFTILDSSSVSITAFDNSSSAIVIPNTVTNNSITYTITKLGDHAFNFSTILQSIDCSQATSLVAIGDGASADGTFVACQSLSSILFPTSLTTIGRNAFNQCTSLTSILIPRNVTTINEYAFAGCTSLSSVRFEGDIPTELGINIFIGCSNVTITAHTGTNGWSSTFLGLPVSITCFLADTPILTDQGSVMIQDINTDVHTIRKKPIVAITKTVSPEKYLVRFHPGSLGKNLPEKTTIMTRNHLLMYKGKMIPANHFLNMEGVDRVKNKGDILYNVLMEEHEKMLVNNLVVETLHPKNHVAVLYRDVILNDKIDNHEKVMIVQQVNHEFVKRTSSAKK